MTENTENKNLLAAMLQADFYNHPVARIELIETHISQVFLTGDYAYKVKKPVNFGFLDFSSLQLRKFYCEEEIRLNQRLAPDIYLDVVAITDNHGQLALAGTGSIIEYAVRMRQFDAHGLFSILIDENKISLQHIDILSERIAMFHTHIAICANSSYGQADEIIKPITENFRILQANLTSPLLLKQIDDIQHFSLDLYQSLIETFTTRKKTGHIRECHGDLHLGNIALSEQEIIIFDGIEFNDSFRWIDTMSDLAFLIMDLQDHQRHVYANHLLNRYLEYSGDYDGLVVLRFYKTYRAMVRAKVACLRLQQTSLDSNKHSQLTHQLQNYLNLAQTYSHIPGHFLAITMGVSGSGKSLIAQKLADQVSAIVIRSDKERKRLFAETTDDLYTADVTHKLYTHIINLAEQLLQHHYSVILDATFLDKHWRSSCRQLAQQQNIPFYILHCYADITLLEQRISTRQNDKKNISDADLVVLHGQLKSLQLLDSTEQHDCIDINTGKEIDFNLIQQRLEKNLGNTDMAGIKKPDGV